MAAFAFNASATQYATSPTSPVAAPWATITLDTGGWWSSSNPTRMTVPADGWYMFQCVTGGDVDTSWNSYFLINGTTATPQNNQGSPAGNLNTENLHVVHLNAGDYVECWHWGLLSDRVSDVTVKAVRLPTPICLLATGPSQFGTATLQLQPGSSNNSRGWFSSGDTTRVTVDQTGTYMALMQGTASGTRRENYFNILKNGSIVHRGQNVRSPLRLAGPSGTTNISLHQANAGDYFQIQIAGDGPCDITTFALCRVNNVHLAMATTTTGTVEEDYPDQPTVQEFDTEEVDTDGYHSTVGNNKTVTVPAGLGGTYMAFSDISIPSQGISQLNKNDVPKITSARGGFPNIGQNNKYTHSCLSWMDVLVPGDFFTCHHYCVPSFVTDSLGTFLGLVRLDDFTYVEEGQVVRMKRRF